VLRSVDRMCEPLNFSESLRTDVDFVVVSVSRGCRLTTRPVPPTRVAVVIFSMVMHFHLR